MVGVDVATLDTVYYCVTESKKIPLDRCLILVGKRRVKV